MPIDPSAVGITGEPRKNSWNSKDALLYAVGVGAGTQDLAYTTENTKDTPQRVLPTFAVIIGGGGVPFDKIGSFNPAMLVHGEQGIELFDEIPVEGEIESTGRIAAIWDKGEDKAAVAEMVDAILLDQKRQLPCAALLEGEYGINGLYMGVPVILGEGGVEQVLELTLTADEKALLDHSAAGVQELIDVMAAGPSA